MGAARDDLERQADSRDAEGAATTQASPGYIAVRLATPADAAAVAAVINAAIDEGFSLLDTRVDTAAERDFIACLPRRGFMHVAEAGAGAIVGVQTLEPYATVPGHALDHVATVGTWVAPGRRRRGVGRRLWDETRRRALRAGFEKVVTDVRADNSTSLAFHDALGFAVIGTARRQARVAGPTAGSAAGPAGSDRRRPARRYVDVVFIECFLEEDTVV